MFRLPPRGSWFGFCAAALLLPGALPAQDASRVTAPSGLSWLGRRGLFMSSASFGRVGDIIPRSGPAQPGQGGWPWRGLDEKWSLTGMDVYRLNCRSCHNADGTGLPPEINSVLDPVRAASPGLAKARFESRGRSADPKVVQDLVKQARDALASRFHFGGEKMPAFSHLTQPETDVLMNALGRLAGVPEAKGPEPHVSETLPEVGQLLVKGTCLICHDAAGPGSSSDRSGGRLIPSLAAIVETRSVLDVIRKVKTGSPTKEGHGEMPLFSYLSDAEIGAAYVYLVSYPPQALPSN
jgi:mono/diheme cytochrome c family protein